MKTSLKNEFKRLFRESFDEPQLWLDWFMESVYRDEDLLMIDDDDRIESALLLSRYEMSFHGIGMPVGYISCAATAKAFRGKGLMHRLITRALNAAAERGDIMCSLIPASDSLYFFYDKFGFATVYYIDEMRYTALHTFTPAAGYVASTPDFETFRRLERMHPCTILHTAGDFANIKHDIALDSGKVLAVSGPDGSAAMAFVTIGDEATVKYMPATDSNAAEAVLACVRAEVGEKPIIVWSAPDGRQARLRSRGMARIVNVGAMLSAVAAADTTTDQVIRVTDPIIPANDGIYILRNGECERTEQTLRRTTLDVSVDVLTRIVFSSQRIAEIFGITGSRPMLPLMLD